jgi:hypothetical protein
VKKVTKEGVQVFYCDRCKRKFAEAKPMEVESGDTGLKRGVTLPMPVVKDRHISFKEKDLCGDCVRGLCSWLKKK